MKLKTLDRFNEIVIQMHDNPDADAVGSGYALYKYFIWKGKQVRLIYGGKFKITKRNILMLIDELNIPVEYVMELDYKPELILTVDCQYGEGNVQKFDGENIAMIDHHHVGRLSDDMCEIRSHIVSCATVCYDMLIKEGFNVNGDVSVATALYYGLYMDSNELTEIRHPLERDMIEQLKINKFLVNRLKNSNFTLQELEIAGIAIVRYNYDDKRRLSIIKSNPCDPNILGLIGDLVMQVDSIDVNIIFNECQDGYKLSVRSCIPEVAANELAEYLTDNIGNGGGHLDKAGGFIKKNKFDELYCEMGIELYLLNRINDYYNSYDTVYANEGISDSSEFTVYTKKTYTYGYVKTSDMFKLGTKCRVRTYEGDVFITVEDNIYLMIGYFGETYPIEKESFEKKYTPSDKSYEREFEYEPLIMNLADNNMQGILGYAKECVSCAGGKIMAKKLEKDVKVFTKWDYEKYMHGAAGDYICYPIDDDHDIYIIKKEVFDEIYVRGDEI